jgi:hypothetical protein
MFMNDPFPVDILKLLEIRVLSERKNKCRQSPATAVYGHPNHSHSLDCKHPNCSTIPSLIPVIFLTRSALHPDCAPKANEKNDGHY